MRNLLLILPLWLFASCAISEVEIPHSPDNSAGDTADSLGYFQLELTGDRATRATTTTITKEQADNFLVTIYKGTDVCRETALLKDINKTLSAGYGYTIVAESCTERDAEYQPTLWGQRRYQGTSAPFAIKAGQITPVGVSCSVANAGVAVVFDKTVSDYFTTSYTVTVTDGERSLVFDKLTGGLSSGGVVSQESQTAYFNVGEDGTHEVVFIIHAERPGKTLDRRIEQTLSKAHISSLNLNYEMSTFTLNLSVDDKVIYVDDVLYISDDDIKPDQGDTDMGSTHDGFSDDDANVVIDDYE